MATTAAAVRGPFAGGGTISGGGADAFTPGGTNASGMVAA